jgi:hypothetical protein
MDTLRRQGLRAADFVAVDTLFTAALCVLCRRRNIARWTEGVWCEMSDDRRDLFTATINCRDIFTYVLCVPVRVSADVCVCL